MAIERNKGGRSALTFRNLGPTRVIRIPSGLIDKIHRLLTIINQWNNDNKEPLLLIDKFLDFLEENSQSKI